jgi:hypothetical protein
MINKGQWVLLPAKEVLHLHGLQLSPPRLPPNAVVTPVGFVTTAGGGSTKTLSPLLRWKQCNLVGASNESFVKSSLPTQPMVQYR